MFIGNKNIDSMLLLDHVVKVIAQKGYRLSNLDVTVIAQKPKIAPYLSEMRDRISSLLNVDVDQVNIKATTEEHLGFTGREEGISCHAVCLLDKI